MAFKRPGLFLTGPITGSMLEDTNGSIRRSVERQLLCRVMPVAGFSSGDPCSPIVVFASRGQCANKQQTATTFQVSKVSKLKPRALTEVAPPRRVLRFSPVVRAAWAARAQVLAIHLLKQKSDSNEEDVFKAARMHRQLATTCSLKLRSANDAGRILLYHQVLHDVDTRWHQDRTEQHDLARHTREKRKLIRNNDYSPI